MPDPPQQPEPPAPSFGTTMRIEIGPEMLEEVKRAKAKKSTGRPLIRLPKPGGEAAPAGSQDFQQILQNIYDAGLITGLDGQVAMVNLRANQFFNAEPRQLMQYNILALIYGAEESLLPTILRTVEANRFVLMQAYCVRIDGSFFPAEISVAKIRLGGNEHLSFFVRDVTVRKEQEERLRTGYTALQNSSNGIAITGLDAEIEYWNPAFLSLLGLSDEQQMAGHNFREFLCEPDAVEEVLEATQAGRTWSGELEMKRADGSTFFGQASVTANLNTDGEQVGEVLSVFDVTPQKRARQQLEAYASELRVRNVQMQDDLNLASELHQAFLPTAFQVFPAGSKPDQARLRIESLYSPSGTIGGDFFDIVAVSEDEVALFISDVMGHGIRSALVVATIRGLIEQLRPLAADPAALMTQLNATYSDVFKSVGTNVIFSTALYAVMNTRTGILRCASASHPRPYLLRRGQSELEQIEIAGEEASCALGLLGDKRYSATEFRLAAGDLLLLYTDGLSETQDAQGEFFETSRFEQTLRANLHLPARELLDVLLAEAKAFSSSETFEDDICMLALEVRSIAENAG